MARRQQHVDPTASGQRPRPPAKVRLHVVSGATLTWEITKCGFLSVSLAVVSLSFTGFSLHYSLGKRFTMNQAEPSCLHRAEGARSSARCGQSALLQSSDL